MKSKLTIILLTFFCLVHTVTAQNVQLKEKILDSDSTIIFAKPTTDINATQENEIKLINTAFTSNPFLVDIKLNKSYIDESGFKHDQYFFYYKGFLISGVDYSVHSEKGLIQFANGKIPVIKKEIRLSPALSINQAELKAKNEFRSGHKIQKQDESKIYAKNKELLIYYKNGNANLAYLIETGRGFAEELNFIDAETGILLQAEPLICTFHKREQMPPNSPGTAATLYSGNENFITDAFNGQFRLREDRNGVNILTLNSSNDWNVENIVNNATDFFDNDNNWQANEHGLDRYATDVHWATEQVLDYWQLEQNRNSIDGNGLAVRGYVHTNDPFSFNHGPMNNAFWDRVKLSMFYGDGDGFILTAVASLDVISHEFGHGICQFTANLPGSSQGGALNEGFSDIWGATIEHWAAPIKQPWLMGEEISFTPIRNMQNPQLLGNPDCMNGIFWFNTNGCTPSFANDFCGVHNNSTVLGHWYFLLVNGGAGTNDLGNNFAVNDIGWTKAAKIVYETEKFLPSSADFVQTRITSVERAIALYGANSCEVRAVENAWFAVGVGNASTVQPLFTSHMSGPDPFCGNATFSIDAIPAGATITNWTSDNPSAASIISFNGLSASILGSGSGNTVTITATVTTPATSCYNTYTVSKQVWIGPEFNGYETISDNVSGPDTWVCTGSTFLASFPAFNSATNYQWTPSSNLQIIAGQGTPNVTVQANTAGQASLSVAVTTFCGNTGTTKSYYVGSQIDLNDFSITNYDCIARTITFASSLRFPNTIYYWTLTEYTSSNGLLSVTNITTTNNTVTFTLNPKTDHGTLCLQIDVGGCGISDLRCYNFSPPCPRHIMNTSGAVPIDVTQVNKTIIVYPNPAKDKLNIQLPEMAVTSVHVEVIDALGQIIQSKTFGAGRQTVELPVKFAAGQYFIKVRYNNKASISKVIKE